jgi:small GTP-binding protein
MPEISIVVLGSGAVGKSATTIMYIQNHFIEKYDSTIEDIYRKPCSVDGEPATLTIVDTAGQDAFSAMRENYMRSGQAFVLVFSITDAESLQKLKVIYAQLVRVRGENSHIPCVVVGNKIDLSAQRAVPSDQGKEFARYANCHYFEITARDKGQVEEVFAHLVRLVRRGSAGPPIAQQQQSQQQQQQGGGGGNNNQQGNGDSMNNNNNRSGNDNNNNGASGRTTVTPGGKDEKKKGWKCLIG